MKYLTIILMALMFASCGKEDPAQGSGVRTVTTPGPTQIVEVEVEPPLNNPQFYIPCKDNVTKMPELLVFTNNNFYKVSGNVGANVVYSYLPPANYISADGRNCAYTINNDGTITD